MLSGEQTGLPWLKTLSKPGIVSYACYTYLANPQQPVKGDIYVHVTI